MINKWLKTIITRWLGIPSLINQIETLRAENKQIKKNLDHSLMLNLELSTKNQILQEEIAQIEITLKSIVKVGVDYNLNYRYPMDLSWAVVCIEGKQDIVQFYNLGRAEAQEIQRFLAQFSKGNKKQDLPYMMSKFKF